MRQGPLGKVEAQRGAKEAEKLRREVELSDLQDVMALPAGRRVLYRIVYEIAGAESLSYTGSAETYFREGRRDVGLTIRSEMQDNFPELYLRMIAEKTASHQEDLRRRKEERASTEMNDDE
jgi:hypothetical protein